MTATIQAPAPTAAPAVTPKYEMARRLLESIPPHRTMPADLEAKLKLAHALFKSGLAGAFRSPEACFYALCYGDELGMAATESLRDIYVINNKPACDTNKLRGIAEQNGLLEGFRVVERTDARCIVKGRRPGEALEHEGEFSIEDAKRAGLAGKDNWKNYPKDMLFARATGRLLKVVCPRVARVTREEAEDEERPAAPAWQMTAKVLGEMKAVEKARGVTLEALKEIARQATGGRKVEKIEGIPQYSEGEATMIMSSLKSWRPAPSAPATQAPPPAATPAPENPDTEQDAPGAADSDGIPQ